jgi:hypothetical protein
MSEPTIVPDDSISQVPPNELEPEFAAELNVDILTKRQPGGLRSPNNQRNLIQNYESPSNVNLPPKSNTHSVSNSKFSQKSKLEASMELQSAFLLNEINSEFPESVIASPIDGAIALLYNHDECALFENIKLYRKNNPTMDADSCLESFGNYKITLVSMMHSDALVQIAYGMEAQAVLVYNAEAKDISLRVNHMTEMLVKGLFLVVESSVFDKNERFIRIYASFDILARRAEMLTLKFPLNDRYLQRNFNLKFKKKEISKRSAVFKLTNLADFKNGDIDNIGYQMVKQTFFTPEKKNFLTYSIVSSVRANSSVFEKWNVSVVDLIEIGTFIKFFSLHEGMIEQTLLKRSLAKNYTSLYTWACSFSFGGVPLEDIKYYYGVEVALYFAWFQFYAKWFSILGMFGLLCFAYTIYEFKNDELYSTINNVTMPIFGFIIGVWSLLFFKFWKRESKYLAFIWDADQLIETDQFESVRGKREKVSIITGKTEIYEKECYRGCFSL